MNMPTNFGAIVECESGDNSSYNRLAPAYHFVHRDAIALHVAADLILLGRFAVL